MVALTQARALDFGDVLPGNARTSIRRILAEEPSATRKIYAALLRKVWSLLIERRFDPEVRDWHALIHDVKSHLRDVDQPAFERLTALGDLVRESISLSETSPARSVAARPNAQRILTRLAGVDGYMRRRQLLAELSMRSQNLSNVLTQLLAHNLVERRDKGKEAEFRVTRLGRQLAGQLREHDVPVALSAGLDIDVISLNTALSDAVTKAYFSMSHTTSHGGLAWLSAPLSDVGIALQDEDLQAPSGRIALPGASDGRAFALHESFYQAVQHGYATKRISRHRVLS